MLPVLLLCAALLLIAVMLLVVGMCRVSAHADAVLASYEANHRAAIIHEFPSPEVSKAA